jgi:hypothetical protein
LAVSTSAELPGIDAFASKVSLADANAVEVRLQYVAALVEEYSAAHHVYPVGDAAKLVSVESLAAQLGPERLHRVSATDLAGHEFLYWSDGSGYVLIAVGTAGRPAVDYVSLLSSHGELQKSMCRGANDDSAADIAFLNGQFCSWRKGTLQ